MASNCLAGLRVLVTRPAAQSEAWQACLRSAGATPLALPLLVIEPVSEAAELQAIKGIVLDFDQYAAAIFVSQNAVHYGCDWLDRYWPQTPLGVAMLAVGATTGAKLAALGYAVSAADAAMNSEALLALAPLQAVKGQKIAIFRGCGGRPWLGEQLTARGAKVDYCELYQRRLPQAAAQQLAALGPAATDLLSVHSGATLDNLCSALAGTAHGDWLQLPILVPGQRVAGQARAVGFSQVIEAENATDGAMLAALQQWCSNN